MNKIVRISLIIILIISVLVFVFNTFEKYFKEDSNVNEINQENIELNLDNNNSIVDYYSDPVKDMGEKNYKAYQEKLMGEDVYVCYSLESPEEKGYSDYKYYPVRINITDYEIVDSYDGKIDEKWVDISDYDKFMLVNIEITNLYDKDRLYVLPFNDVVHYLEGTELDRYSLIAYNFEDNRPYFYRKDIKESMKFNGKYYYGEILLKANETVKLQAVMAYRGGDYNFSIGEWVLENRLFGERANSNYKIYLYKQK
ncbi:hypothetical protein [Lachnospira sp.]|jgi:hypothetical protein|uniref:hypothetical protein n=1 Tax=Lachnospira sp. TaxID=2049031 RepID=UPI00257E11EE|nr:hypothetical protein [Lachnospira sp.]